MEIPYGDVAGAVAIRPLISRATILILATVLVAMGIGAHLPAERAGSCLVWGSYGLLVYGVLEVTAKYRSWRKFFENRERSGHKLDQWITTDLTIRSSSEDRKRDSQRLDASDPRLPATQHVLVIEDDLSIIKLIRSMLLPLKIRVLSCSQPDEAMELARNAGAILCDLHLGTVAGTDIVRNLRRRGFSGPIIMISGDSSRATIDAAIRAGIDDFLIKPFSVDNLVHRLRRLIMQKSSGGKQLNRELSA